MNYFEKATELWGDRLQLIKTTEECGELIQAISKYLIVTSVENNPNIDYDLAKCEHQILIEAIDVEIMLKQLKFIFDHPLMWISIKKAGINRFRESVRRDMARLEV